MEQFVRFGASPWEHYNYYTRLLTTDEHGLRGRPGGRFEKWSMNQYGFRGPEIMEPKPPGLVRVVALGSSETFGLHESPDSEWPRALEQALVDRGVRAEVLNAALPGMGLAERFRTFRERVLPVEPEVVVLMIEYPSIAGATSDRLEAQLEGKSISIPTPTPLAGLLSLRAPDRFNQVLLERIPRWLIEKSDQRRFEREAAANREALGSDYRRYRATTEIERAALLAIVTEFLRLADLHGVRVVLAAPPYFLDYAYIFHSVWPRVDVDWIGDARRTIDPELRELASRFGAGFVDLDHELGERKGELMVDYFHFNDAGAEVVAQRVADEVVAVIDPYPGG